jgi:hypothetical protein
MDNEMRYRDTMSYCITLLRSILKVQRNAEKRKALEFVIDKLRDAVDRSYERSKASV